MRFCLQKNSLFVSNLISLTHFPLYCVCLLMSFACCVDQPNKVTTHCGSVATSHCLLNYFLDSSNLFVCCCAHSVAKTFKLSAVAAADNKPRFGASCVYVLVKKITAIHVCEFIHDIIKHCTQDISKAFKSLFRLHVALIGDVISARLLKQTEVRP